MRRILTPMLTIAVTAALLAGCGDDTKVVTDTLGSGEVTTRTVPDIKFAKTKFVIHAGLAAGAFYRYIYQPYQADKFASGADGRKRAFVKAGLAALFIYHELKVARDDALASDTLRRYVAGPLDKLLALFKDGSLDPTDIVAAATGFAALKSGADDAGVEVKDRSAPIPGF